jgi:hypothetical protein
MTKGSFRHGYLDGWLGVMGDVAPTEIPEPVLREGKTEYQSGFEYGRADALELKPPT